MGKVRVRVSPTYYVPRAVIRPTYVVGTSHHYVSSSGSRPLTNEAIIGIVVVIVILLAIFILYRCFCRSSDEFVEYYDDRGTVEVEVETDHPPQPAVTVMNVGGTCAAPCYGGLYPTVPQYPAAPHSNYTAPMPTVYDANRVGPFGAPAAGVMYTAGGPSHPGAAPYPVAGSNPSNAHAYPPSYNQVLREGKIPYSARQ